MKRFWAACAFALAVIGWTAGCNDYGNTFQAPTGARLSSIAPSNASVGGGTFTLNLFGSRFVPKTVVEWNGKTIPTAVTTDSNNNVLTLTATVDAALLSQPGLAKVNTLNPHSGSSDNGLSNTINFVINPAPNPLPELDSITPNSTAPGSPTLSLNLTGKQFIPTSDPSGGSQVRWNANGTQNTLAVVNVSATQITATVPADLLASETCAIVSVYNPPAVATTPPSGIGNPFNGGGGTSSNGANFFPGFAVSTDATFITNCTTGLSTNTQKASAALAVAEETPALGSDGRFVAYTAVQNGHSQVFIRDTCTGATTDCQAHTTLLSAAADGTAGNADSHAPSMSTDGRFVAFSSAATNLVVSTPAGRQIFLRDTCFSAASSCTPQTTLVSIDEAGALAGNDNLLPSLSSSGRFVAFLSVTPSKYPASQSGTPNSGIRQIFVRDTCLGARSSCTPKTTRLSVMPGDTSSLRGKPAGPAISSSAQAVGVSSANTPTVLTRSVPVDDRVFLALTGSAQN